MNRLKKIFGLSAATLVLFAMAVFGASANAAWALAPEEIMPTPEQEARAATLEKQLRCPVCQNQSIHDSDADLARDMRGVVRQKILDRESDERIKAWLVDRYGAYVLMDPPLQGLTFLLWLGPIAFAAAAAFAGASFFRGEKGQ